MTTIFQPSKLHRHKNDLVFLKIETQRHFYMQNKKEKSKHWRGGEGGG